MASKIFFQIDGNDLTGFADIQNYSVNQNDVYQNWTDGNWIEHRDVVRRRVEGEVKLGFAKAADFAAFTALLISARQTGGWYPVTVYVNNTGAVMDIEAFLEVKGAGKWDLKNGRQWVVQTIQITQR